MRPALFKRSAAVFEALQRNAAPVVALESTIISHGMPFPQNLEMAREVEQIVRDAGAVPATIAVIDGVLRVGLDDAGLETLARGGSSIMKCSRREIPMVVATRGTGATTVAGTMAIAAHEGIKIFATGGIGELQNYSIVLWSPCFDVAAILLDSTLLQGQSRCRCQCRRGAPRRCGALGYFC